MPREIIDRFVSSREAYAARARVARRGGEVDIVDPITDLQWAKFQEDSVGPNPYFDYFFSGEDVRCYVGETGDDPEYGDLPLLGVAFNVEQQKIPVHGYWSYTYDTMLKGTRVITGQYIIYTKYPGYMKRLLATAAKNRSDNYRALADNYPSPEGWREDDQNLEQYWGKNLDKSALEQQGTEWSIHPPFSFVIVYGVQGTSLDINSSAGYYSRYQDQNLLAYDRNERLEEGANQVNPSRIILDGCELTSVQYSYQPSNICVETYSFMARDIFIPTNSVSGERVKSRPGPLE